MHKGALKHLFQRARELRNEATHPEIILWNYLRTKPLGFKFRRQHPYANYIFDFYCHAVKLVIEVDGNIHALEEIKKKDIERQKNIEQDGLIVIRFKNKEVEMDLQFVINTIEQFLKKAKNER